MTATVCSVPQYSFSVALATDTVLCVNSDPFTWTFEDNSSVRIRRVLDLGVVHVAAGTVGQADVMTGFWIVEAGTGAPASPAITGTSVGWGTRHIVRHATKDVTYPLGSGVFDFPASLDAGDWEMWLGIGCEDELDLGGVTVTGYTPNGFIELNGYEVNF
jgi:hypothetical protein